MGLSGLQAGPPSDAGADKDQICHHTRLEAVRYLLTVPRGEFRLLAEPDPQPAMLDAYLRQLPHDETVIEFTGNTMSDLAIAVIAGFNWLNHCAGLAGADRRKFPERSTTSEGLRCRPRNGGEMKGASERYAQLLQAQREPPLFLYLVWADYGRLANEIAAARVARRGRNEIWPAADASAAQSASCESSEAMELPRRGIASLRSIAGYVERVSLHPSARRAAARRRSTITSIRLVPSCDSPLLERAREFG